LVQLVRMAHAIGAIAVRRGSNWFGDVARSELSWRLPDRMSSTARVLRRPGQLVGQARALTAPKGPYWLAERHRVPIPRAQFLLGLQDALSKESNMATNAGCPSSRDDSQPARQVPTPLRPRTPEQLKARCIDWPESVVASAVERALAARDDVELDDDEWRALVGMVADWLTHPAPDDATPFWLKPADVAAVWRALRGKRH